MTFRVKVTACLTKIIAPAPGTIQNQSNMWYDDEIVVDLNSAFSGYIQEPNCQYAFTFSLKYEKDPQTFPGQLSSLPAEAIYNAADRVVYLQKCSDVGNPNILDLECEGSPYEKRVSLVVVASLVGDPQQKLNADLGFTFTVGDVC